MRKRVKLIQFRIGLNFNQEQMAKYCNISRSTYGEIERGETDGSLDFWNTLKTKGNLSLEDIWAMQYESK